MTAELSRPHLSSNEELVLKFLLSGKPHDYIENNTLPPPSAVKYHKRTLKQKFYAKNNYSVIVHAIQDIIWYKEFLKMHCEKRFSTGRKLTKKEFDVLSLLLTGCSIKAISEQLGIDSNIVNNIRCSIERKWNANNYAELIYCSIRNNVLLIIPNSNLPSIGYTEYSVPRNSNIDINLLESWGKKEKNTPFVFIDPRGRFDFVYRGQKRFSNFEALFVALRCSNFSNHFIASILNVSKNYVKETLHSFFEGTKNKTNAEAILGLIDKSIIKPYLCNNRNDELEISFETKRLLNGYLSINSSVLKDQHNRQNLYSYIQSVLYLKFGVSTCESLIIEGVYRNSIPLDMRQHNYCA